VRSGKRCIKAPRHIKTKHKPKRCASIVTFGSFTHADSAGLNMLRFTGRPRGRKLKPGRYALRAVARNIAGKASPPLTTRFRIIR
jgi:hypothetical protein